MDYVTRIAAAIFATGPKTGQLVTASNPAKPGDVLSVYGTGIGQKAVTPAAGMASSGVDWAVTPVTVKIGGGQEQVLYAGSTPGYAVLDQYNVVIPGGVGACSATIKLLAARKSN